MEYLKGYMVKTWGIIQARYRRMFLRIETKDKAKKKTTRKKSWGQMDDFSQYQTIKHLMKDLDLTFRQIKRLTPKNGKAQKLLKKYGPFIAGLDAIKKQEVGFTDIQYLDGFKAYGLPSHLLFYMPKDVSERHRDLGGKVCLEIMMVAQKIGSLPYIGKRKNKVFYEFTTVAVPNRIEEEKGSRLARTFENTGYIQVDKLSGEFEAIKVPIIKPVCIPTKHRNKKTDGAYHVIHKQTWDIPDFVDHEIKEYDNSEKQRKEVLEELFSICFNWTMRREYGINVIVKKGSDRATFVVPQDRWKYFFKDRIKAKSINGNTRPIYHSVTSHKRELKSGKTSYVKTHYRGMRHFWWNGYEIRIVMQGKDGLSQAAYDVVAETPGFVKGKGYDPTGKLGDNLNKGFEGTASMKDLLKGVPAIDANTGEPA